MDGKIFMNYSQRSKNAVYLIGIQKPKWIWDPVLMSARCALQTAGFILIFHFGLFRVVWLEGFWLASHQLHSVLVVTGWCGFSGSLHRCCRHARITFFHAGIL